MSKHNPGVFITIEGGDGAGKSTLLEGLVDHLEREGIPLFKTRAPGGTSIGQEIRKIRLSHKESRVSSKCELLLFMADRAQHVEEIIRPALEKGQIVLCDRFNDSTIAYQGAARGFSFEEVESLCDYATGGLKPDLTLYLDLPADLAMTRRAKAGQGVDRIESEALNFHEKIREGFLTIAAKDAERFKVIDATQSPEDVLKEALHLIHDICGSFRE